MNKIPITFEASPASYEVLSIGDKLGEGKFSVYTAYSPSHQTKYALKVFPNSTSGVVHYSKEFVLSSLSHPNIIKCIPIKCHTDTFYGLLTEFADFGGVLDLVMKGVVTSEVLIRTYFHQLVQGIEYLHSQRLAHLDIKLENLVLGSDYKLKIIDFDQVQSIGDKKMKYRGTPSYRPPEVLDQKCDNLGAVDIYSAGIVLFAMIAREFPFKELANENGFSLKCYSMFVKENKKFWEMKANRVQDKAVFNDDLTNLLNGMLEYNVDKRFKLQDIKNSKWYQGPVLSEKELMGQMKARLDRVGVKKY